MAVKLKTRSNLGGMNHAPAGGVSMSQLGMSGLKRSYGYIYEELLPQLQGRKAINVFQEMAQNSAVIGAFLFAIDMFMRKVAWRVEAADQTPKGQKDAKFLTSCKDDMEHTWADFISEINSMLTYGWSWFEICYKQRTQQVTDDYGGTVSQFNDGMVGWQKFMPIAQESWWRWDFDPETGKTIGMWQRPAPDYSERYLPYGKSLHFRTASRKDNPEGVSVLRTAYRAWYFLKRIEEIEAIGVERDLAGIPIATVPAEMLGDKASLDDKKMIQSIIKLVQNVRRDEQEGIVWPQAYDQAGNELYTFKLLTSGGTRQFPTNEIISRYESRVAMTVLADWILLGNEAGNGSYALSTSKASMFQSALETWLDVIENVINNHAVPLLFRQNGIKGPYPKFRHDIVQKPSLPDLATIISAMAGAGAQLFPDTGLENHIREFAELPIREENKVNEGVEEKILAQQLQTQLQQSETQEELAERTAQDPNAEGLVPNAQGSVQGQVGAVSQKAAAAGTGTSPAGQQTGPGGKQPGSKPGAPTKSTGPVKSKLPPQKRRATVAVRASQNQKPKTTGGKKTASLAKHNTDYPHSAKSELVKQLSHDFPVKSMRWLDHAVVEGPVAVPVSDVNTKDREEWAATHEPAKVALFRKKMSSGQMKPVLLTQAVKGGKKNIVDGHHRFTAAEQLGHTHVLAFVAHVPTRKGPWDEMHASQFVKHGPSSTGYDRHDTSVFARIGKIKVVRREGKLSQKEVDYRPAKDPDRRCGTCSMFRISGDDEHGECTLVQSPIDPNNVCNRWTGIVRKDRIQEVLDNTSKPQKKCDYCQRRATKIFMRPGAGAVVARSCPIHAEQARAELRWAANNQVSPVNPNPYEPFPRVLTQ